MTVEVRGWPAPRARRSSRLSLAARGALLAMVGVLLLAPTFLDHDVSAQPDGNQKPVYIVSITGAIDLGLAPYLERVLEDAEDDGARAVILEIDTPGGRLDAVLQMKDVLLDAGVPTIAFVNRTAFSAGALIAIACEQIYMVPGAVMGAATPVDGTGEFASQKVISAVRKTFKSTAEVRGRDPIVAEAMVEQDVVVEGLDGADTLLTLTTVEAAEWGYTNGVVADRSELLQSLGLDDASVIETSPSFSERVVRFITDPVVASLMITAAILLIIGDLFVGGFGAIGGVGLLLLALFFWGHNLAGLAGWEDVALVLIGLILVGIEVFVIPGFGVPGLVGLGALTLGFWLAMVGGGVRTSGDTERAGWAVALAMIAVIAGVVVIFMLLPNARLGGLVLQGQGVDAEPAHPRPARGWLGWFGGGASLEMPAETIGRTTTVEITSLTGARGLALSDLRPSGIAKIDNRTVDVVTQGEYLYAGDAIIVLKDEGYRRIVRRYVPGLAEESDT